MNLQTHTTNIPSKGFSSKDFDFPLYKENTFIDYINGKASTLSSDSNQAALSSCAKTGDFHLNGGQPIMVGLSTHAIDEILQIDMAESLTDRLENFIAERFLDIPSVEFVFLSKENDSINIWTVINKLDRKIREKIYDIEYDILGILRGFRFDFHVMCRNDRNIEEIRPSNAKMIFQKQST
jgi:hypothetical protein